MKSIGFVLIALGVCGGCSQERGNTGSLAIMELAYADRTEIVYLANDYGFLIQWVDGEEAELYLYNKPANKIQMTRDFPDFLARLEAFPNDARVDRIRGCGITAGGMGRDNDGLLRDVIKAKRFHLTDIDDGNFTVCSCETIEVRRYTTANEQLNSDGHG